LAASAAGSFQRERESGVMELLLVSPISESKIIWGRVRGLWGQFLPAFILLLAAWLYLNHWLPQDRLHFAWLQFFCVGFVTLPVIGLCNSLRWKSFVTAFLMTFILGLLGPLGATVPLRMVVEEAASSLHVSPEQMQSLLRPLHSALITNFLQVYVAVVCAFFLLRILRNRNFAFTKPVT
jgi:ABC-type Na+ efflux pump permease subunit